MILNLKFEYRDLTTENLEILLQDMQGACGGKIYSIEKVKDKSSEELQFLEQIMIGLVRIKQKNVNLDWARDIMDLRINELKNDLKRD